MQHIFLHTTSMRVLLAQSFEQIGHMMKIYQGTLKSLKIAMYKPLTLKLRLGARYGKVGLHRMPYSCIRGQRQ